MNDAWLSAIPSILIGTALILLPGAAVIMAGWGVRSLVAWLFAPAISIAIIAVASSVGPVVGLTWSLFPVAIVTAVAALVAWAVSRWVARNDGVDRQPWEQGRTRAFYAAGVGAVAAAAAISVQLMTAFGTPENISQTFDNIVHLNAIRLALDLGDASVVVIGSTSDIAFYPNGWHSVVTLVAQLGGGSIPLAVNAANIAIFAIAWPVSALALGATLFAARPAALAVTAVLTTGFAAFPLLLLDFGVLYPNATGYAVLPAALAAVWMLLTVRGRDRVRALLLLLVTCAAVGISHPNAFLALFALAFAVVVTESALAARAARTRRARLAPLFVIVGMTVALVGLWRFGRTNAGMSVWGAWQSTAQAFGEAALISPRGYPITIATSVLLLVGMIAIVRHPSRWLRVALPFATAAFLFIVVSGLPIGTTVRDLITNPWYNDSYRLAAILPLAGVPVAVVGALVVLDAVSRIFQRRSWPEPARLLLVTGLTALLLLLAATGPNVTAMIERAHDSYRLSDSSPLLTRDEQALIARLDETVPDDAVLIVNPWTGGSLAYALGGKEVVARHVFSARSADQEFIDANLGDIDSDPEVCSVVNRLDAEYVLDFGSQNVWNNKAAGGERAGLNDLDPSEKLVLIDSEGDDARLFQIVGC
ncbi:DUF6541 family protein [Microbacterium aurantiacum]|uniref:4-amino-4-deoxy-L-arabinose transferase-like glycosyltransferase n=1 Tax=Microbacterium aurantiacum TaxID=162393 RepID=A0A0M8MNK5_9MICO|nr:DUF6541 family protein [Microbacterium chocolatum]ANG85241.1 hypothetical protein A8L33_07460 [Microbacterium chocolatum]KOS11134.1 hypothetical protein XI38_07700 [Microbacterium chocolatum]